MPIQMIPAALIPAAVKRHAVMRCLISAAVALLVAGVPAHAQNTKSAKSVSESAVKPGQATGKPGTPSTAGMSTAKYPDGQQPPATAGMGTAKYPNGAPPSTAGMSTGKRVDPNAPTPGTATMKPPPQPIIPRANAAASGKP